MAKNKIFPVILLLTGLAFVLGALFSWFDNLTAIEPVGLGKWIFDVLEFVVGAGAGIGGWLSLKKSSKSDLSRKTELKDNSKDFERVDHYHEAPVSEREFHETIGFIPPVKTEKYIHRGKVEDDVVRFIHEGGKGAIVGVHAPGGLGKTELAKQVAGKLKEEFEIW